jgi:hypothetical protein
MNATEFKRDIQQDCQAIVPITEDDFVSVVARPRGFSCRLIRSLEDDSDASTLLAEYQADSFTELVRLARQARKEWKGEVIRHL